MTNNEPLPPIEHHPPYSLEFVAHLHGGCYGEDFTPQLLAAVRKDAGGVQLLDDITRAQSLLATFGVRTRNDADPNNM